VYLKYVDFAVVNFSSFKFFKISNILFSEVFNVERLAHALRT